MTPQQKRNLVNRFEESVREHAFIGAAHPGDHLGIERQFHRRKALLLKEMGLDYTMPLDDEDDD